MVLDREQSAGGIPRHSDHLGYGIRDLRTFITGPAYAHRLTRRAETAGARIVTRAMVTAINPITRWTSLPRRACSASLPPLWCWPPVRGNARVRRG